MTDPVTPVDLLALCDTYDLTQLFGRHVESEAPWLRFRRPDEVEDPETIEFALGWLPRPERLRQFPNLKLICSIGAGADGLLSLPTLKDTTLITRLRVEEQAAMMAGFAVWHVIWHQRGMGQYLRQQQDALWKAFNKEPPSRTRVGILGYGHMGKKIAKSLDLLGFPLSILVRNARGARAEEPEAALYSGKHGLAALAAESDVLINVLPLTAETKGLLSAAFFAAMKPGAYLINLGRGQHLNEADLVAALDSGQLSGTALDVFATEPLPADSPLWRHPKILVTPHVASEADDAKVVRFAAAEIRRYIDGEPLVGLIDRSQGY